MLLDITRAVKWPTSQPHKLLLSFLILAVFQHVSPAVALCSTHVMAAADFVTVAFDIRQDLLLTTLQGWMYKQVVAVYLH
jgi:hypothetical protein